MVNNEINQRNEKGLRQGFWKKEQYLLQQKIRMFECYYVDGRIHGLYKQWNPNELLNVREYFNEGVQEGEMLRYRYE